MYVKAISLLDMKIYLFVSHGTAYIKAWVFIYNVSTDELSHFDVQWYWRGGKYDGQIIYKEYMTVWCKNIIAMNVGWPELFMSGEANSVSAHKPVYITPYILLL